MAWDDLCVQLEALGAIQPEDAGAPPWVVKSEGQRLLLAIRAWGGAHSALLAASPEPVQQRWLAALAESVRAAAI